MFEGFNESTIGYYQAISTNNCKNTHQDNQVLYLEGVKYPLEELYYELYSYFSKIDNDLLTNKKNALGFFFDASLTGYKFGLTIYNLDARGMEKIRDYILDNKHYAKEIIEKFNKAGLLEVRGEKYKRAYYPDMNAVLQEWLERKRISFVYEDKLSSVFYGRDILNRILAAFDSVQDVYFMLKEALQMTNI